jgi:L-amino acid N-acyltransferase YncA
VNLVVDVANMEFISLTKENYPKLAQIYLEGIATGIATFETSAPSYEDWDKTHLPFGRILAVENDQVLGWASLAKVSDRCVYGGVAENSIYVATSAQGKGVGTRLLQKLIEISEANGIWTLQCGIMRANKASIALHEKCGFRIIGYRENIGKLNGTWKDNLLLERRSRVVGI